MLPHDKEKMPKWIFQQDNYPKHFSQLIKDFLKQNKIKNFGVA